MSERLGRQEWDLYGCLSAYWIAGVELGKPYVNHCCSAISHTFQTLPQGVVDLTSSLDSGPKACSSGDCNCCMVAGGIKSNVEIVALRLARVSTLMDIHSAQHRTLPPAIVENDRQEGCFVLSRHPMHCRGNGEEIAAITTDGNNRLVRLSQLGPDGCASMPSETCRIAREVSAWNGTHEHVADWPEIGNAFAHDYAVFIQVSP